MLAGIRQFVYQIRKNNVNQRIIFHNYNASAHTAHQTVEFLTWQHLINESLSKLCSKGFRVQHLYITSNFQRHPFRSFLSTLLRMICRYLLHLWYLTLNIVYSYKHYLSNIYVMCQLIQWYQFSSCPIQFTSALKAYDFDIFMFSHLFFFTTCF